MKAVVPLNVAALRVSSADDSGITSNFAGRTAMFDKLPYRPGTPAPSTGDQIWRGLDAPAAESLGPGIHLHWELPDYFKRGVQDPSTGQIRFPAVPNRWLVSRTLRIWDDDAERYGPPQATGWVVESDYLTPDPPPSDGTGLIRPPVAVPLRAADATTPYLYLGRPVAAADWDPAATPAASYLPAHAGPDGKALFLTSIGFTGAAFSSYYPDCSTVFGHWDRFGDVPQVARAITRGDAIRFAASYAVTGWLHDPGDDPLNGFAATVAAAYDDYVGQCAKEDVPVARTPAEVYRDLAEQRYGWQLTTDAVGYTLHDDSTLADLAAPDGTLCAGTLVDVVWAGPGPFLAGPARSAGWSDTVQLAAGNTTPEAVAALVAGQLTLPTADEEPVVVEAYETLLEALQLGVLRDLESDGSALIALGRARHDKGFTSVDGGYRWTVTEVADPQRDRQDTAPLPLTLVEQLAALNRAQQAYDRARAALVTLRQQLFMDWLIYVQSLVAKDPLANALAGFLAASETGELKAVVAAAAQAGRVEYRLDPATGRIDEVTTSSAAQTLAGALVAAHRAVTDTLTALTERDRPAAWALEAGPAPAFWLPTDPVLVIEGPRIEPSRRTGAGSITAVRTDAELLQRLELTGRDASWTIDADRLTGLAAISAAVPDGVAATLREAALLDPQRTPELAALVENPPDDLATALAAAVGGQSRLDPPVSPGLFEAVRTTPITTPNPVQEVGSGPTARTVTFTNADGRGYAPDPTGWCTQAALPEFSEHRFDPYLPVWMLWSGNLDPLAPTGEVAGRYAPGTVTDQFALDPTSLDFDYSAPARFTTGTPIGYRGEVVLSKTPMVSLVGQIDTYLTEFAADPADPGLTASRDDLAGRRVMSQALDTFNLAQTLRRPIPQLAVMDLTVRPDLTTTQIADAANADPDDSWYDSGWNALQPIPTGPQAIGNFGPLRSGFLELRTLSLVDVFGQRLSLDTAAHTANGALTVSPAGPLTPAAGDTANADRLYLPPRVLTPTRMDARWLPATPDGAPVCGWLLPNHLDVSLMCYDADGRAIGSFTRIGDTVRYQTRAGNLANPDSDLAADVGPAPGPGPVPVRPVNDHLAAIMWFLAGQSARFLSGLLATIDASQGFIAPSHAAQDVATSVLIGRPLAVVRMALGLATAGATVPISQSQTALREAIDATRTVYPDRQTGAGAALDGVRFGVEVGDHTDLDDGLVGYLPEHDRPDPYQVLYSSAAPTDADDALRRPGADTVTCTLNQSEQRFTALIDPRAPIHLTSGLLPTTTLQIPPSEYAPALQRLEVAFTTRPVLADRLGLRLPLPTEPGYVWAWVPPGAEPQPFAPSTPSETPVYGHGPQTLQEGWLLLQPDPKASS